MERRGEDEYEFLVHFVCTLTALWHRNPPFGYLCAGPLPNKPFPAQKETKTTGFVFANGTNAERGRQLRGSATGPGRRCAWAAPGLASGRFLGRFQEGRGRAGQDAPHPTCACSAASDPGGLPSSTSPPANMGSTISGVCVLAAWDKNSLFQPQTGL